MSTPPVFSSNPNIISIRNNLNATTASPPEGSVARLLINQNLPSCTPIVLRPDEIDSYLRPNEINNLGLSGCTGLTSLPPGIQTGIQRAQLYFSIAASVPSQTFSNLDTALTFWVKATNDETLANPPITIDSDEALSDVLNFLSRLTTTAEYKNPHAQPVLAMRVIEAFCLMAENESIKGRAFEIIHEGLISCDDRIIAALEEIELMVLLHQIENKSHAEVELRVLGKRFLLLEMVNEKAKAHKNTLTWVDEVEIYLTFQIGLAEKLDLPVKTRNMIFRVCAQVTDEQINQAGDAVLSECTEEKLNNFLKSWNPWIKHQRKNSPVPVYEDLPVVYRNLGSSERCPITQYVPEKPVLCGHTVYDYDALIHCYRIDGRNPVDRSPIDLQQLKRIVASDASSKA